MDKSNFYSVEEISVPEINRHIILSGGSFVLVMVSQGKCLFEWNKQSRVCLAESFSLMEPNQELIIEVLSDKLTTKITVFRFSKELLKKLSTEETDLLKGFSVVPFKCLVGTAPSCSFKMIVNLITRLNRVLENEYDFGKDIFQYGLLSLIIVMILHICIGFDSKCKKKMKNHFIIDEIFAYIREHILEDISLERLEKHFYISKNHISREFKRYTGDTIHSYILKSKLEICCEHIKEGLPIIQIYSLVGFNDYNSFFRIFKKVYGVTPKEYYHNCLSSNR